MARTMGEAEPADHLKAIHLGMRFTLRQAAISRPLLSSSADLLDYLRFDLSSEPVELLRGLFLDARNILLHEATLARGSINEVQVSPREVVRQALEHGATALILIHNHPSGDPTPSAADIAVSQRVAEAASLFEVQLHDHLIVGRSCCVSLAALGHLKAGT